MRKIVIRDVKFCRPLLSMICAFLMSLTFVSCTDKDNSSDTIGQGISSELNFYNWAGYTGKDTIQKFEEEYGVQVNFDNYSSNEELLAKLQGGATGYDLIFPTDYMVEIMIKEDLLSPLNLDNIPNFTNIYDRFRDLPFDPDNEYSIPYLWGTSGIGVDTSRIKNIDPSWDLLWDERLKNNITMLDDMRFGFVPALKKLGYSINTTNPSHIEEAKNLMMEQKPFVKAYTNDTYMNLLRSGEVTVSYGWSGDIAQVSNDKKGIEYIIPEEGTNIWVDNMSIPKGAPNKKTAELFINFILRPDIGAGITNDLYYASPNKAAEDLIRDEILNDPGIYPPEDVVEKSEFLKDVGEATRLYNRAWSEIKAR